MTRGLTPWSRWSPYQRQQNRQQAAKFASNICEAFRETGDWQTLIYHFARQVYLPKGIPPDLLAEAVIRELEITSLEEIVMKTMMRR